MREVSPGIPLEITKFGDASYRAAAKVALAPGEYGVILAGRKMFTFGVGPKE
jgi:hypothetical protein